MELVVEQETWPGAYPMWPGPYVKCSEEGCAYTLHAGILYRHRGVPWPSEEAEAVDLEVDVAEHERPRMRRIIRSLTECADTLRLESPYVVYVPRAGDKVTDGIARGSAIIGDPKPGAEEVLVYYEGAVDGQVGMARLADRARLARVRLATCCQTKAQINAPRSSLIEVGVFHDNSNTIVAIDAEAEAALAGWLGKEELDPTELRCSRSAP